MSDKPGLREQLIFAVVLALPLTILLVLAVVNQLPKIVHTKYFTVNQDQWNTYDKPSMKVPDLQSFLAEADKNIAEILAYLKKQSGGRIQFLFVGGTNIATAGVGKPVIFLGNSVFQHDNLRLPHELSHLLEQSSYYSLNEGLAEHLQDRYGARPCNSTLGFPVQGVARLFLPYCSKEVLDTVVEGGLGLQYYTTTPDYLNFNIFAHSFVRYLIGQYGIDRFMAFYRNVSGLAYQEYFGKTAAELRASWLNMLKGEKPIALTEFMQAERLRIENIRSHTLSDEDYAQTFNELHNVQ